MPSTTIPVAPRLATAARSGKRSPPTPPSTAAATTAAATTAAERILERKERMIAKLSLPKLKVARAVSPTPQPLSIIPDHRSAQPLRSALKPATTTHPAGSRGARLDRAHHRHERKVRGDAKSVTFHDGLVSSVREFTDIWCALSPNV